MAKFNRLTEAEIDLRTFFNPESGDLMSPQASEDSFLWTLPLNAVSLLRRAIIDEVVGAPGVLFVLDGPVPSDSYWYVEACALNHNDAVSQSIAVGIANSVAPIRNTAIGSAIQVPNLGMALIRRFLVPPGFVVRGEALALGVAAVLTMRLLRVELKLAEISPNG